MLLDLRVKVLTAALPILISYDYLNTISEQSKYHFAKAYDQHSSFIPHFIYKCKMIGNANESSCHL
jgi:hypothetical protein